MWRGMWRGLREGHSKRSEVRSCLQKVPRASGVPLSRPASVAKPTQPRPACWRATIARFLLRSRNFILPISQELNKRDKSKDDRSKSFAVKEKRKRDSGQSSRERSPPTRLRGRSLRPSIHSAILRAAVSVVCTSLVPFGVPGSPVRRAVVVWEPFGSVPAIWHCACHAQVENQTSRRRSGSCVSKPTGAPGTASIRGCECRALRWLQPHDGSLFEGWIPTPARGSS